MGSVGFGDHERRFFFHGAAVIQFCGVEREQGGTIASWENIADGDDPEAGGMDEIDAALLLLEGKTEDKHAIWGKVTFCGLSIIADVTAQFESGMGLLRVRWKGSIGDREVRRAAGDELEFALEIQFSDIALERGDAGLELVAFDVCAQESVTHVLSFDAGERRLFAETPEDDEADGSDASSEVETGRYLRGFLEGIPSGGGIIDGVTMAANALENSQWPGQATDENGESKF